MCELRLALEKIGQLIEGRHENPFELLGPHEVHDSGRRALAVRAFLPHSTQAWVVDPAHAEPRVRCGGSIRPGCSRRFARAQRTTARPGT